MHTSIHWRIGAITGINFSDNGQARIEVGQTAWKQNLKNEFENLKKITGTDFSRDHKRNLTEHALRVLCSLTRIKKNWGVV